jgi:hypothetical protein
MEWISVNDRLPLKQEDVKSYDSVEVIVATRCDEVLVMEFAMGNTVTPWHQFGDAKEGWITHWMPLPNLPPKQPE